MRLRSTTSSVRKSVKRARDLAGPFVEIYGESFVTLGDLYEGAEERRGDQVFKFSCGDHLAWF